MLRALELVAAVLFNAGIFAAALLLPAGTLRWWRAWVVVGVMFCGAVGAITGLARTHSGVLEERMKPPLQRGQPLADRILVVSLIISFFGMLVFTSLDATRFHWMTVAPGPFLASAGLAILTFGYWLAYRSLRENAFAALAVRHQEERHQIVVDTGVYGIVRHPMYAGAVLLFAGIPLWLRSYPGALAALAPVAVLVLRISVEERLLRRELPGYSAYTERARFRLVPFVW